jgi:hypothetical protein
MAFKFSSIFWISIIKLVSCQRISEILSSNSQLSSLAAHLKAFPSLAQTFDSADNFTFLAPNNLALATWFATANCSNDSIKATLEYHLLNGTHPSGTLSSTPEFLSTSLTNVSYSNVTGGQRLEASSNGHVMFKSGLKMISNVVTSVCIQNF